MVMVMGDGDSGGDASTTNLVLDLLKTPQDIEYQYWINWFLHICIGGR